MSDKKEQTSIRVAVRLRPLNEREIASAGHDQLSFRAGPKSLTLLDTTTFKPIAAQTYAYGEEQAGPFFFVFFVFHFFFSFFKMLASGRPVHQCGE